MIQGDVVAFSDSTIPAEGSVAGSDGSGSAKASGGPGAAPDVDSSAGGGSAGSDEKPEVKTEEPPPVYGNSWAIIIGCESYQRSEIPVLRKKSSCAILLMTDVFPSAYAINDANRMKDYLQSLGFNTFVLLNHDATKEAIEYCLGDSLKWKVASYDRVLVFFAGKYCFIDTIMLTDDNYRPRPKPLSREPNCRLGRNLSSSI